MKYLISGLLFIIPLNTLAIVFELIKLHTLSKLEPDEVNETIHYISGGSIVCVILSVAVAITVIMISKTKNALKS